MTFQCFKVKKEEQKKEVKKYSVKPPKDLRSKFILKQEAREVEAQRKEEEKRRKEEELKQEVCVAWRHINTQIYLYRGSAILLFLPYKSAWSNRGWKENRTLYRTLYALQRWHQLVKRLIEKLEMKDRGKGSYARPHIVTMPMISNRSIFWQTASFVQNKTNIINLKKIKKINQILYYVNIRMLIFQAILNKVSVI